MSNEFQEAKTIQDCLDIYSNYQDDQLINGMYSPAKIAFITAAQTKVLDLLKTEKITGIALYLELEAHDLFSSIHQIKGVPATRQIALLNIIANKVTLIPLYLEQNTPIVQAYITENNIWFPTNMSTFLQKQATLRDELREETRQQRAMQDNVLPIATNPYSFVAFENKPPKKAAVIELAPAKYNL